MEQRFTIYTADNKVFHKVGVQLPTESGIVIQLRDGSYFIVPGHNLSYYETKEVPILGEA